jgi:hypothetical protein
MNLLANKRNRPVSTGPTLFSPSLSDLPFPQGDGRRARRSAWFAGSNKLSGFLVAGLCIAALASTARAQSSVGLAWNPEADPTIVGYNLYYGAASGVYTNSLPTGSSPSLTVSNLAPGTTYYFAVTAVNTLGLESVYSAQVSYTVPSQAAPGLTFAADSGTITAPFVATNGTISQASSTSVTNGGRAAYTFTLPNAGSYYVAAIVSAPSTNENSFYVNIDAEPTDPLMIWDIPISATFTSQPVSWRGNGTSDPNTAQFRPKTFQLTAGTHQLIIRGREANATLATLSIVAAPPTLKMRALAGGRMAVDVTGQPGQIYKVMASSDLRTWASIGSVTLSAAGTYEFVDSAPASGKRFYRLTQTP